jgi:large repetitive protein
MRRVRSVALSLTGALVAVLVASCSDNDVTEPTSRSAAVPAHIQVAAATASTSSGASFTTDKDDYLPGDTLKLAGTGWQPGDSLDIHLDEVPENHPPLDWTVGVDESGGFRDSSYVVQESDLGVTFALTATSRATGESATATFTDGTITFTSFTFFPGGSTSGSPPGGCTGASGTSVASGSQICALASFSVAGTGGTPASIRWRNPSGNVVQVDARSPNFPNGASGAQTFAAAFTPTVTGTWSALLCESTNLNTTGANATGCPSGSQRGSATFTVTAAIAATSTVVISSQNPSAFGESVTFTATVTTVSPVAAVTAGSVTFREGTCAAGAILQPAQAVNGSGQVTFDTAGLSVGSHTIRGCYAGTAAFSASEGSVTQEVNNTATDLDLTSSVNPSVTGQSVTFTATVTNNSNPVTAGQVAFKKGGTACADAAQVQAPQNLNGSGQVTYSASFAASQSPITIRACYSGSASPVLAASEAALVQTVNQASTTTTVTSSPNPSVFSQAVTLQATVSVVSPGTGTPAGNVTFKDGTCAAGTTVGTDALDGTGHASVSTSALDAGSHTIRACYAGNADFDGSDGSVSQTVNQAGTTTTVTSLANPSVFSQSVGFNVTVSPVAPAVATPVGNVTLKDGTCAAGASLGTIALNGTGHASFNVSTLGVGIHTITACYAGNPNFEGSDGGVSQVVNKAHTTTAVLSSPNPSVFSQSVTFDVTVSSNSPAVAVPAGSVTLMDGTCSGTSLGSATLSSGAASFDISTLTVGSHTITACYAGNASFEESNGSVSQQVNKAETSAAIASSVNPSILAQPVTFTVTVTPVSPAVATPQGDVTLTEGSCSGTSLGGPTALNGSGQASFTVSTLTAGAHTVTACYAGNDSFKSSENSLSQQVKYNFDGLYAPVDRPNTMNVSKAGQAIPLKWRLTDYNGAPVLNFSPAAFGVAVSGLQCTVSATLDQIEEYAGNSGLQNLGDGYYQFNWKTPVSYANSCKSIGLNLGEASPRGPLAYFNFKK